MLRRAAKRVWAVAGPAVLFAAAYAAVPACVAAAAALVGLGVVAALDVWCDVDFVDGTSPASALVVVAGLIGFHLLRPAAGRTAPLAEFAAWSVRDWAVLSLAPFHRAVASLGANLRSFRRLSSVADGRAGGAGSRPAREGRPAAPPAGLPLVHSVIWGRPARRGFVLNCPAELRTEGTYEARQ